MRLRLAVLASALSALAAIAIPGSVNAAPTHNRGLTIAATPDPVYAGEGVLIYGRLYQTGAIAGQTITLYHHLDGSRLGYTKVAQTTTDANGFYEFLRAEDVVLTNRDWFVRESGVNRVHSRTLRERVAPVITLLASKATVDTNQLIVFYGHVTPDHARNRAYLQEQEGLNGDDWRTLATAQIDGGSSYAFAYDWRVPGVHELRVMVPADGQNVSGTSDQMQVTVQQTQVKDFTITSAPPVISAGQGESTTISGVLYKPGTTTPESNTSVTLWGHAADQPYTAIADAVTRNDGSYTFTQSPPHNETYQVRTTLPPARHSAQLYEAVRDNVTINPSSTASSVGGQVTFTGSVAPAHQGHLIYLQRKDASGDWHDVAIGVIDGSSNYRFTWTFGSPGMKYFRVEVPGGPDNVAGASSEVTITVSLPPVSSLPPGQ